MSAPGLPTIYPGMRVEVSDDETFSVVHVGEVIAANNGRPHIIARRVIDEDTVETAWAYGSCVHQNDPELESLKESIRQNPNRGVYRLAWSEIQAIHTAETAARLEYAIDKINAQLEPLAATIATLQERVDFVQDGLAKMNALRKPPGK